MCGGRATAPSPTTCASTPIGSARRWATMTASYCAPSRASATSCWQRRLRTEPPGCIADQQIDQLPTLDDAITEAAGGTSTRTCSPQFESVVVTFVPPDAVAYSLWGNVDGPAE